MLALLLLPALNGVRLALTPLVAGEPEELRETLFQMRGDERLRGSVGRTAMVAGMGTALVVPALVGCALALFELRRRAFRVLLCVALLPMVMPETGVGLAVMSLMAQLGIPRSLFVVAVQLGCISVPYGLLVLVLARREIPESAVRAIIDAGAGVLGVVRWLLLPLMWPAVVATSVIVATVMANDVVVARYVQPRELFSPFLAGNISGGGSAGGEIVACVAWLVGLLAIAVLGHLERRRVVGDR